MPQNGKITANEVIEQGALLRVQQLDAELRKILKTYTDLAKAAQNVSTVQGANKIVKERIDLDKQSIEVQKKLAQLDKDRANAEAAKQRAVKAGIQTQNAQNNLERRAAGQRSTNLAQFKSLNSAYQQQSRLLTALRQRQKDLNIQKLQGIRLTKQEQAELRRLSNRIRNLDANLKKVDAAAGQFQRNVGNYPKVVGAATRSLRAFAGAFGFTSGIFLLVGALRQTFKIFKDFDQAQADLAAILGKSRKQIERLTKQAKQLGSTTAFTATQVAKLQLELSKLGFSEDQILASAEAIENLAIATGVEAARAAKLAGAAIRGFALEAEEANRVASVLAVSTTKSASSFETLEVALPKVSAIAKAFNFSIEDTVALLSGLQNAGFEASIAGTSLRQIFLQLADSNGKLAKRLGGNVTNFDELVEAFKRVEKEGIDLAEAFELTNARSVAAFKVFLQGADDLKILRDSITDVDAELQNLAETKLDSLQGDITLLTSAWEGLVLSIEDGNGAISRFFRNAVQGLNNFLTGLREANITPQEAGVLAAEKLVDDFKNSTRVTQQEVKNFIITTVQEAEENIENLRNNLNSLIDSSTISRNSDGELINIGLDFTRKLDEAKELERQLNKEIETRNELFNQLNLEQKRREDLTTEALALSIEYAEQQGDEINTENQLRYIRGLATSGIEKQIKLYKSLIEQKEGNNKANEEELTSGTIAFYEDFIKNQQKLQKETATNTEEFDAFQRKIDEARASILALQGAFDNQELIFTPEDFELSELEFIDPDIEPIDVTDFLDTNGVDALLKGLSEKTGDTLKEIQELWADNGVKNFQSALVFTEKYLDLKEQEQERIREIYDGIRGVVSDTIDSIFQVQVNRINDQIEANNDYYDAILEREGLSEQERDQLQKARQAKDKKLREEQEKLERQSFLFRQLAALADVAIDTFRSVAAIKAQAAILASNPLTVGLAPLALAQIPLVFAAGGVAGAGILAQTIPAFFKGKDASNNYEGWASVNELPGQREIKVDKYGGVTLLKAGIHPEYLEKDDLIIPSMSNFNQQLESPTSDLSKRFAANIDKDIKERTQVINVNSSMDLTPLKGIIQSELKNGIRNGFKGIKFPKDSSKDNYTAY